MKDALIKAGIQAVRREARKAIDFATQIETDLANRKGWSEREQALFMQTDANHAIEHLQTALRALESIRSDVREVLAATDPPALRKELSATEPPLLRTEPSAVERGHAMHAEAERLLRDLPGAGSVELAADEERKEQALREAIEAGLRSGIAEPGMWERLFKKHGINP